jgi:hypothetical protein
MAPNEAVHAQGQAMADAEPLRQWHEFMGTLAWVPGVFTATVWDAGLRGCSLGIPLDAAIAEIRDRIVAAGGNAKPGWVERNVGRAFQTAKPPERLSHVPTRTEEPMKVKEKVKYEQSKLAQFAAPLMNVVDVAWLADRSPVDPMDTDAGGFLSALYLPGERVVVLDVFASQGQWLWSKDSGFVSSVIDYKAWEGNDRLHERPPVMKAAREFDGRGPQGIWYLTNPVSGEWKQTGSLDSHDRPKWSRRSEPEISAWRYFTLESDIEGISREWIAAMCRLPLPIAAMYTSGGKSVHVLVRVDASSKRELDMWRETALRTIPVLGGDPQNMTSVRLSRLPGCLRLNDKNEQPYERPKNQRLLYLDPSPSAVPICDRTPVRDSLGPLLRMAAMTTALPAPEVGEDDVKFLLRKLAKFAGVERARTAMDAVRAWRGNA